MKIFITGGSGFIGTNAIDAFAALGWTILNYSTDAPLKKEQAPFWRQGDILDAARACHRLSRI